MASKKELRALITLAGKIDPSLQSAMLKASSLSASVSNKVQKASSSASKAAKTAASVQTATFKATKQSMGLYENVKKASSVATKAGSLIKDVLIGNLAAKAITKVGRTLLDTGKNGLQLASDLKEVQNVVDVTFGKSSTQIDDWSKKALDAFGLSELQAKEFNGTLGAILKSSGIAQKDLVGMSQNLTGLAGDFSSFFNVAQDDAFSKIRSGISGETEPLKQLGINMSVANLEAYALSKGIKVSYENMDEASKVLLRYGYLMEKSKDAQGDFKRTQGEFANQSRLLKVNFDQLSASIATKFLPAANKAVTWGNKVIKNINIDKVFDTAIRYIDKIPIKFADVSRAFTNIKSIVQASFRNIFKVIEENQPVLDKASKVIDSVGSKFKLGFDNAKPVIEWMFITGVPAVTNELLDLVGQATDLYNVVNDNWSMIAPVVYGIAGAIGAYKLALIGVAAAQGIATLATNAGTIAQEFHNATMLISAIRAGGLKAGMIALQAAEGSATIAQWALNAAMNANPIALVAIGIGLLIAAGVALYKNWDKVTEAGGRLWGSLKKSFGSGVNWVVDKLNWLLEKINKIPGINIPLIPRMQMDSGVLAASSSAQEMAQYASGGIATRPSIFGEAGPEMAIPLERTPRSLGLLTQTAQILGVGQTDAPSQPLQFIYSPVYYGGNREEIQSVFEIHKEEIQDIIEDIIYGKRRTEFG